MQLVTFAPLDEPRLQRAGALLDDGQILDLAATDPTLGTDIVQILTDQVLDRARAAVEKRPSSALLSRAQIRLAAPIPRPGKIVCVGYNYFGHTPGGNEPVGEHPDIFVKTGNTIVGPGAQVVVPRESHEVDYEAELAVVIGRRARRVSPEHALDYAAGYSIFNDLSARDWQRRGSQWLLGKSFDGFGPLGPALVTADEVGDPQALEIELTVNGERTVHNTTERMIFPVAEIISYISEVMTLEPGDIIATGTPQKLPEALAQGRWLAPGDRVAITIGALGTLTTSFIADQS